MLSSDVDKGCPGSVRIIRKADSAQPHKIPPPSPALLAFAPVLMRPQNSAEGFRAASPGSATAQRYLRLSASGPTPGSSPAVPHACGKAGTVPPKYPIWSESDPNRPTIRGQPLGLGRLRRPAPISRRSEHLAAVAPRVIAEDEVARDQKNLLPVLMDNRSGGINSGIGSQ
jgi:hypothetical protein